MESDNCKDYWLNLVINGFFTWAFGPDPGINWLRGPPLTGLGRLSMD